MPTTHTLKQNPITPPKKTKQVSISQDWIEGDFVNRVPIIVTGNDFSTLFAPLVGFRFILKGGCVGGMGCRWFGGVADSLGGHLLNQQSSSQTHHLSTHPQVRDGRMDKFFWAPDFEDKVRPLFTWLHFITGRCLNPQVLLHRLTSQIDKQSHNFNHTTPATSTTNRHQPPTPTPTGLHRPPDVQGRRHHAFRRGAAAETVWQPGAGLFRAFEEQHLRQPDPGLDPGADGWVEGEERGVLSFASLGGFWCICWL
jgi:hypothetical protein